MQVTHLAEFGFLAIRGKDAISFLQGYTTCDLDNLSTERSLIGAICNIQGRMVSSFRIASLADGVLLRLDKSLVEPTRQFLAKYIVFSKAKLSDMSESYVCYGVIGDPQSPIPAKINGVGNIDGGFVIKVSETGPRYEIWSQGEVTGDELANHFWQQAEITDGYAWVSSQTTEEFIPQMFNYHNIDGIDFDKGCYLGQEIIARLEYRGKLKRQLHRGTSIGPVAPGDDLINIEGKVVGPVVSVAESDNGYMLLAVLQNAGDDNIEATVNGRDLFTLSPIQVVATQ